MMPLNSSLSSEGRSTAALHSFQISEHGLERVDEFLETLRQPLVLLRPFAFVPWDRTVEIQQRPSNLPPRSLPCWCFPQLSLDSMAVTQELVVELPVALRNPQATLLITEHIPFPGAMGEDSIPATCVL